MDKREFTISAVIPTRNRPKLVVNAVKSVFAQTFPVLEAVVVIDGPDEHTEQALKAMDDPRIRIVALKENVGGSEARNLGVQAARGNWIGLLDDDDTWLPDKIAMQVEIARQVEIPFPVLCSRTICKGPFRDEIIPRELYDCSKPVGDYLFCRDGLTAYEGSIPTSTIFCPKAIFERVPFLKGLKKHQDWDWVLQVAQHTDFRIVMLPQALSTFDTAGDRASVSRVIDWRFSADWARKVRPLLTARAYTHFLGIFCSYTASAAGGGLSAQFRLFRQILEGGSLSFDVFARMAFYGLIPDRVRRGIRRCRSKRTIRETT